MKRKLEVLSVFLGALAYLYIVALATYGTGEGLSFTTFALWAALSWIATFTILKQGANHAIPLISGIGSTSTAIILLIKGKSEWSEFDSVVAILVILCLALWLISGPRRALILSVVAGAISSLPFIIMTWKSPTNSPIISNSGFLMANILAFASAKAWTIEDRLYTGAGVAICLLLIIPWLRY